MKICLLIDQDLEAIMADAHLHIPLELGLFLDLLKIRGDLIHDLLFVQGPLKCDM